MTSTLTLSLRARNANHAKKRYQICLIHPFDPRGQKVGGLETYIRDFITFHPADTDILFIGVDSAGDLALGQIHNLRFRGRNFDFLPILHYSDDQAREAARSIRTSLTGQFFVALLRHFKLIARLIRARQCSVDLRRVEFSWLPAVLRLPFVQMLHGEGAPKLQMDSLLRKYSFVHNTGERFAVAMSEKFLCVNPFITERLQKTYPRRKDKIDTLWTWVNTEIFKPQPMPESTSPFRIVFAGRLDEFKDPPLMFRAIDRLRQAPEGRASLSTTSAPAIRTASPNSPTSRTSPFATASRMPREWRRRWRVPMPAFSLPNSRGCRVLCSRPWRWAGLSSPCICLSLNRSSTTAPAVFW